MKKKITVSEDSGKWQFAFRNASMATVHVERKESGNLRVYIKPGVAEAGALVYSTQSRVAAFACGMLPGDVIVNVESDSEITEASVCSDGGVAAVTLGDAVLDCLNKDGSDYSMSDYLLGSKATYSENGSVIRPYILFLTEEQAGLFESVSLVNEGEVTDEYNFDELVDMEVILGEEKLGEAIPEIDLSGYKYGLLMGVLLMALAESTGTQDLKFRIVYGGNTYEYGRQDVITE